MRSVDEYIAAQPKAVQPTLGLVRRAIRSAVPKAEESISYRIPAYKLPSGPVLYFAAWKRHYSLYPASDDLLIKFAQDLAPYKVVKRTLRFPYSEPVPVKLIAALARFRSRESARQASSDSP